MDHIACRAVHVTQVWLREEDRAMSHKEKPVHTLCKTRQSPLQRPCQLHSGKQDGQTAKPITISCGCIPGHASESHEHSLRPSQTPALCNLESGGDHRAWVHRRIPREKMLVLKHQAFKFQGESSGGLCRCTSNHCLTQRAKGELS